LDLEILFSSRLICGMEGSWSSLFYLELYSFTLNPTITVKSVTQMGSRQEIFQLPLSMEAYDQYCELDIYIYMHAIPTANKCKSCMDIYLGHLLGTTAVHPTLKWTWKTKCQTKHKVIFCLLLQDRLNTRRMLRRRNKYLDSYVCEMCI
jgi:hypothetical protein